jgi:hypothetical protein
MSCPIVGVGMSNVETSGSITGKSVVLINLQSRCHILIIWVLTSPFIMMISIVSLMDLMCVCL